MIDMTNTMMSRITNLNVENERIAYQMSTGKELENGSDNSVLYARILNVEDKIRVYEGLENQINRTTAQNDVADTSMGEIKNIIDSVKVDLMKSVTAGLDLSAKAAIATNLNGLRENLFTIANSSVDGEYLFTGSDTTVQTFSKDANFSINGKVSFDGDAVLRKVAVEPNTYRERGVTAFDVLMYNADTAGAGEQLDFYQTERIVDENAQEWKITDTLTVGGTIEAGDKFNITIAGTTVNVAATDTTVATTAGLIRDAINNDATMAASVVATLDSSNNVVISAKTGGEIFTTSIETTESDDGAADNQTFTMTTHDKLRQFDKNGVLVSPLVEISVTNDSGTPAKYTTASGAITGTRFLESKHNYFDDLNIMINALKGYATNEDGTQGSAISSETMNTTLQTSLTQTSNQYDASNIGHAELGGRNNIFNIALERISAKQVHYNILLQEIGSADMAKLAMESKSLELTYQALYSTVAKMNELSLINFIK